MARACCACGGGGASSIIEGSCKKRASFQANRSYCRRVTQKYTATWVGQNDLRSGSYNASNYGFPAHSFKRGALAIDEFRRGGARSAASRSSSASASVLAQASDVVAKTKCCG